MSNGQRRLGSHQTVGLKLWLSWLSESFSYTTTGYANKAEIDDSYVSNVLSQQTSKGGPCSIKGLSTFYFDKRLPVNDGAQYRYGEDDNQFVLNIVDRFPMFFADIRLTRCFMTE